MPRALESKRVDDPMLALWSEKRKKSRLSDRFQKATINYNVSDAAEHYVKTKFGNKVLDKEQAKLYRRVVEMYFHELSINIIQKNYPYTWYRIGEFFIAKFNGSPIVDLHKSAKHSKLLSFVNLHTSGWTYMFYWAKKRTIFYNRDIYEFKPAAGKDFEIGRAGVRTWIKKLHDDNKLTDYNAFIRNDSMQWKRRKKREEANEKRKQEKEQKQKGMLA